MHGVTEPGINRDGIKHVLETVQWYWELADLLDADGADESTIKLQELLEKHIVSLYKKLLVYQMQSVCLYNKHWAAVLVRDLVKIDDWQDKVDSIKQAEEAIREKIKQKNSEVLKSRLTQIDGKLGHLRLDVQAVTSAVGGVESAVKEQTQGLLKVHYDEKDNECLKDLHIVNPQTDKKRLEKTKGGLLKDSYRWILDHDDYRGFRSDPDRRLLWIKGDPGKGKTMLLCGITNELENEPAYPLSYFFCHATQDHLRSAISVLRSLIWLVCKKQPTLMPCVRESYDMEGKKCFEDLFSLKGIPERMLQQPCLRKAVLIVDALDECSYQRDGVVEREELIDLIIELSKAFSAKWIVSSRNWPVIEGQFRPADKIAVSLELDKDSISRAVEIFVRHKTDKLALDKGLDHETKEAVLKKLLVGANDTFLWVALVCNELARPIVKTWETLAKLDHLRTGLNEFYKRMLEQIVDSDYSELCREILAVACVAYRPLSLDEFRTLVPELQAYRSEALRDVIGECGSFLTIQEDVVYFVHQSAQDFLVSIGKDTIFPSGIQGQHRVLFRRSLETLKDLRRDIYGLKSPGVPTKYITPPDPDPLCPLKYAILYWIDHLEQFQGNRDTSDDNAIDKFLREKYLYWLEALSLQRFMEHGPDKVQRLRGMVVTP
ncbi:NACHT domain-containing protein [Fusarium sp. LHS14.1]|nr:NACHT domain-containing protein [Fusarium sp. LHS14.1]